MSLMILIFLDLPPTYDPNWNKDNTHKTHQGGQHQQYEHPTNIQQQPLYYQPPGYQQQGYYVNCPIMHIYSFLSISKF